MISLISKRFHPFRHFPGVICLLLVVAGSVAAQSAGMSAVAQREMNRRAEAATRARELLLAGDRSYEAGNYAEAVSSYGQGLELLPDGAPAVAVLRDAAVSRFSKASVERARELRRHGDVKGAIQVVEAVLAEGVAPRDPGALAMRDELWDPVRTNPAVTREHAANVEEVRFLLYRAQGAYDLGKYDEAAAVFEDVLRADPYNTAARRGLEKVAAAKSAYAQAAYDQTRAGMLAEVDASWERPVTPAGVAVGFDPQSSSGGGVADYVDKLNDLTVPAVQLEQVTLQEAADFLRQQSIQLDTATQDPLERGVSFVVQEAEGEESLAGRTFSLTLRQVTLAQLIDTIAEASGTEAMRQPYAVVFRPPGGRSDILVTRSYRVPPDFLTSSVFGETGGEQAASDPFAPEPESDGLQARRLTAREKLESLGVSFPEGASASFISSNSTLRVRNTPLNHSLVEQLVETIANEEPASVVVEVKIIKTRQEDLEELGFDWILSPFGTAADVFLGGGTIGSGIPRTATDFISPVNFTSIPGVPSTSGVNVEQIITGGLRSGDSLTGDSIDSIINNPTRQTQSSSVAPGILALTGLFTDGHVQLVMRGLSQKKGTDVSAVPSVTTRSGQQASIEIIRELIYPTEYEPPEVPQGVGGGGFGGGGGGGFGGGGPANIPVTPSMPTAFDMRKVGVLLDVLPTASSDKRYVNISVKPELTDFEGFVNYGSPILAPVNTGGLAGALTSTEPQLLTPNEILMPVFSKMATETSVTVADGSTLVLGGLLEERRETISDSVPILGDIPFVGRLFRSEAEAPIKTAVVFLLKVRVVDAAGRPFHP